MFSIHFQKVIEKAQNLRFYIDFALFLVRLPGLEPGASGLGGSRSIQLSYRRG